MTPFYKDHLLTVYQSDVMDGLRELPNCSVHCCVTSPPYWGLRDYGVDGQIGLEKTPEEYVAKMVEVFREVKRVLRDDGTLWLNLGDSYASGGRGGGGGEKQRSNHGALLGPKKAPDGLKPKDLVGIPWRVAFALQADGWFLRSDIIWHKPNPMPESVTDRPTKSHEYIFLMSKQPKYFYDAEAVKEPQSDGTLERFGNGKAPRKVTAKAFASEVGEVLSNSDYKQACPDAILPDGKRNKRSVWTVPLQSYPESHFATFPEDLIKPCILAGTSAAGCCPKCGAPWERVVEKLKGTPESFNGSDFRNGKKAAAASALTAVGQQERTMESKTVGWKPSCECFPSHETNGNDHWSDACPVKPVPCTVLDPFGGSFTTAQVSLELGRKSVIIELNPKYVALGMERTRVTPSLPLA